MTVDSNILFQTLGLLGSLIAMIWYVSSVINEIKKELSTSIQLNTMQDKQLEALEHNIDSTKRDLHSNIVNNYQQCREGRVKIWEELNALKLKVATLEAKDR